MKLHIVPNIKNYKMVVNMDYDSYLIIYLSSNCKYIDDIFFNIKSDLLPIESYDFIFSFAYNGDGDPYEAYSILNTRINGIFIKVIKL